MLGAYLHGSAVLGGMLPTSDVDVLAVIDRPTTPEERLELVRRLMPISLPSRAHSTRPIELTVVNQSDVRPWRYPPRMEFQYGEWLRDEYERGEVAQPAPSADLAALLAVVMLGNRPLVGPPPAQVLEPVPREDLRRALVDGLAEWTSEDKFKTDTRNMLLALARTWQTLATGEIARKDAAARWAAERLLAVEAEVVRRAGDQYLAGTHGEDSWPASVDAVRATAARMLSEIETAATER
jgi:streptomycin 3"-adenylyltransferase